MLKFFNRFMNFYNGIYLFALLTGNISSTGCVTLAVL